jgi:Putative peptidase (DUF1758).
MDTVSRHLQDLETLKQPTQHWDTLIVYLISTKFDKFTSREWDKYRMKIESPKLSHIKEFVDNKSEYLSSIEAKTIKGVKQMSLLASNIQCNFCKKNHMIYNCEQFLKLAIPERIQRIKDLKLCNNCLCFGHRYNDCKGGKCKKCHQKHSTLLHLDKQHTPPQTSDQVSEVTLTSNINNHSVLLSTVCISIADHQGRFHKVRAILDSGSQSSFISSSLCSRLKLNKYSANISIMGINNVSSNLKHKCDISVQSLNSNFSAIISCFVLNSITENLPISKINIESWNIPKDINLADPQFNEPGEIHLLIGAELFWDILIPEQLNLRKGLPVLQNSQFGWLVSGAIKIPSQKVYCNFSRLDDINVNLQKFWEIEETNKQIIMSSDDTDCENHFKNNFSRNKEGRFVVKILLHSSISLLGDSMNTAIKRLQSIEGKFQTIRNSNVCIVSSYKSISNWDICHY